MYNVTVPTAEHTYRYLEPSSVQETGRRAEVSLATSGGAAANPYFFTGFLAGPRQTSQALLVVAEVARTRYYEPPNMVAGRRRRGSRGHVEPRPPSLRVLLRLRRRLRTARPRARCARRAPALGEATNVDFNPPMRAALARVHDDEAMLMHVGHDEVRVETLAGSAVERKVPLPERWLKGFAEVQVASARMVLRHDLPRSKPGASCRACRGRGRARSHGRRPPAAACAWPRAPPTPRPASPGRNGSASSRSCCRSPGASGSMVRREQAKSRAERLGARAGRRANRARALPAFRGFSGEGGVLADLATADDAVVEQVADSLHGEPSIDTGQVSRTTGIERPDVQTALGALEPRARGYDLGQSAYFHRELPYDRATLEGMHPRLLGARELVETGLCA